MQLPMILAIARAEIRSVRRLARYWMFAVLSVGITLVGKLRALAPTVTFTTWP